MKPMPRGPGITVIQGIPGQNIALSPGSRRNKPSPFQISYTFQQQLLCLLFPATCQVSIWLFPLKWCLLKCLEK